jgi:hypothetical protein
VSISVALVDTRLALMSAVQYSEFMNDAGRTTTTITAVRMTISTAIIETIICRPAVPVVRDDARAT